MNNQFNYMPWKEEIASDYVVNANGFLDLTPCLPFRMKLNLEKFSETPADINRSCYSVVSTNMFPPALEDFMKALNKQMKILDISLNIHAWPSWRKNNRTFLEFRLHFDLSKLSANKTDMMETLKSDFYNLFYHCNDKQLLVLVENNMHTIDGEVKAIDPKKDKAFWELKNWRMDSSEWANKSLIYTILDFATNCYYLNDTLELIEYLKEHQRAFQYFNHFWTLEISDAIFNSKKSLLDLLEPGYNKGWKNLATGVNEFNWEAFIPTFFDLKYSFFEKNGKKGEFKPMPSSEDFKNRFKKALEFFIDNTTSYKKWKDLEKYWDKIYKESLKNKKWK